MRTEWEFWCEAHGFRLEREHKYNVAATGEIKLPARTFESFAFSVRLRPTNEREPAAGGDQALSMFIDLPFPPHNDVESLAMHFADMVAEKVSFQFGDLHLFRGAYFWERKAETLQEEAQLIEDGAKGVRMHLIEAIDPEPFDSQALVQVSKMPLDNALVAQFNAARRETHPVGKFLSYFRILESIATPKHAKGSLIDALTQQPAFAQAFGEIFPDKSFERFVKDIVGKRHECAHLRLQQGFGYGARDPRIGDEVKSYIPALELLTKKVIERVGKAGA